MSFSTLLYEYALFLAKAITIVLALVLLISILHMVKKNRGQETRLKITSLNEQFARQRELLLNEWQDKKTRKMRLKSQSRAIRVNNESERPRLFVMDFDGDVAASAVDALREQVSAVLQVAGGKDEVMLRLESSGGLVHAYGLAASQLARLRDRQVRLVVAVDKVAASGGYMMACLADKLIAAPFAIIGSVGVVGAVPNLHEFLKKHAISYEQHTAGKYKRTLNILGENTDEGREQFKRELAITHELFKAHVRDARPNLDIEQIATGETWYGTQALKNGLIDAVGTSDDYLLAHLDSHHILLLEEEEQKNWLDRIHDRLLARVPRYGLFKMHIQ